MTAQVTDTLFPNTAISQLLGLTSAETVANPQVDDLLLNKNAIVDIDFDAFKGNNLHNHEKISHTEDRNVLVISSVGLPDREVDLQGSLVQPANVLAVPSPSLPLAVAATLPSDPMFSAQWHLRNTTPGLLDLNVIDVWDDYTGAGVDVAIIDDAVQRTHPDLDANYSILKDWDFDNNDTDPSGTNWDSHGTAVAGIIGATANNGIGGAGIAYDSTIFGFSVMASFQNIAAAINNTSGLLQTAGVNREADVANISLGTVGSVFFDRGLNLGTLNTAIDNAVIHGRDGLGTILVKSAGNSRGNNQDTNASSWSANPHTIAVAAVDQDGGVSSYSTHGASVLVSGFGTPGQVVTTDRIGTAGYSWGDYTSGFNGTSAAAPMVSGVVALMLEANPNLGWRDVQEILAYSARHVGTNVGFGTSGNEEYAWSFNSANNWNGGGLHFSNDYGFGLVNAKAAVRLAETWGDTPETSSNDVSVFRDFLNSTQTVGPFGTSFSSYVSSNIDIEHVEVDINFTQWYDLGDLEVRLISPDGTTSVLIDNSGENNGNSSGGFTGRWEFFSNAFRGENSLGNWTVQLFDVDSNVISPITVNDIDVTFYGDAISANDTFIFTEEYSDYAGQLSHSTSIFGGSGIDTINAAAVDSNTTLNFMTGLGNIDGVNVSLSSIENAFTGDGNDYLKGNSAANEFSGMRGNDYLEGGKGTDILNGGDGNDILNGTQANLWDAGAGEYDILTGGDGADTFVLGDWFGAHYEGLGYATITDFNWTEGDKFQVFGSQSDYSLGFGNWSGTSSEDTLIYYQGDILGLVQDTKNVVLSWDFNYV